MHIPLHRCLVTFGVFLLTVWWVGLQCVIVVFLDQTHLPSTYFLHTHILNKIQHKSGIGAIRGSGGYCAIYKSCGILTRTVGSVVVGHVVLAIHIVHSLETNRAGPLSSQTLVLSEHIFFILNGKGTIYLYCTLTA